jgi:hypothetical protein
VVQIEHKDHNTHHQSGRKHQTKQSIQKGIERTSKKAKNTREKAAELQRSSARR